MTDATPEPTPTTDGVAAFKAATDETVTDAKTDVTDVQDVVSDAEKDVTDVEQAVSDVKAVDVPAIKDTDIPAVKADSAHTIDDVHAVVTDIKATIDSVKPLIEKAGPALDAIVDEIKAKGVSGLLPHLLALFKG